LLTGIEVCMLMKIITDRIIRNLMSFLVHKSSPIAASRVKPPCLFRSQNL